jgi:hypothetical protein
VVGSACSCAAPRVGDGACFSADGAHRLALWRSWSDGLLAAGPPLLVVMLNPSVADATRSDPTMTRVVNLAKGAGHGSVEVVNAFSLVATDPTALVANLKTGSVGGVLAPEANDHVRWAVARASRIVVAWGANLAHPHLAWRMRELRDLLGENVECWGVTGGGQPKHPLARGLHTIPKGTLPLPYRWPA